MVTDSESNSSKLGNESASNELNPFMSCEYNVPSLAISTIKPIRTWLEHKNNDLPTDDVREMWIFQ